VQIGLKTVEFQPHTPDTEVRMILALKKKRFFF